MKSVRSTFPLLWDDERSAVRLKAAVLASLVVLVTTATGLLLMSLAEDIYQDRARGVLWAVADRPAASLPV
ncbi:MAG: hypothetical protein ACREGK_02280 [Geminicoccales bacterium]